MSYEQTIPIYYYYYHSQCIISNDVASFSHIHSEHVCQELYTHQLP